jgi:hypothetical protein
MGGDWLIQLSDRNDLDLANEGIGGTYRMIVLTPQLKQIKALGFYQAA